MPSFESNSSVSHPTRTRKIQFRSRTALTLVEILIALTMTLIVLGAMMAAFSYASGEMQNGRAIMEMANRLRTVQDQLSVDLASLTIDPRVYTDSAEPNGYLEIVERARRDSTELFAGSTNSYLGDVDDIIAMTIRSRDGVMFRGRINGAVQESSLAEVIWFTSARAAGGASTATAAIPSAAGSIPFDSTVRLHRRQLLIRPDLGLLGDELTPALVNTFLSTNDVSCRVIPGTGAGLFDIIPNGLTDLARRENRFAHNLGGANYPNPFNTDLIANRAHSLGEDIMLTDVAAFDIRVYSPNASVLVDPNANLVIEPGDPGFTLAPAAPLVVQNLGAFVDLGSAGTGWFTGAANPKSGLGTATSTVWDSWSPSYESDGFDQDGDSVFDEATNGVDNGGTLAPDDNAERETEPPYPNAIRGIEVTLRLVEKGTKKVHQSSVTHSYVPE